MELEFIRIYTFLSTHQKVFGCLFLFLPSGYLVKEIDLYTLNLAFSQTENDVWKFMKIMTKQTGPNEMRKCQKCSLLLGMGFSASECHRLMLLLNSPVTSVGPLRISVSSKTSESLKPTWEIF